MNTVVLLSGGLDSSVALAHTLEWCGLALSFDYGQTHARELAAATAIAEHYGVPHVIRRLELGPCALTGHGDIPTGHADSPDATFVPGRNIVMLAMAVAVAEQNNCGAVIIGANADDNAGYPDCRPAFIHQLSDASMTGYGISIWAPFVRMTKAQIVKRGRELGVPLDLTWSCYRGAEHPCNRCGACESRTAAGA